MKRIKKTKIIATLGPASSSAESIESLIKEGVDVLRINFSHSTHKEAENVIKEIRKINDSLSTNTAILADLQGDRKSTRLNSSHSQQSRMPSSA